MLLFFRTRPEKRRLDEHFFLFLLHTSVVSRLLRPQRNFSLTQFESELSSNTKKKRKLNQSPSKSEKPQRPNCTNQTAHYLDFFRSGGLSTRISPRTGTSTKNSVRRQRERPPPQKALHTFPSSSSFFFKKALPFSLRLPNFSQ